MSAHVKILKGDLHLAVSTAFNRGRYVLMTGGGDGQPIEITIDLRERPDDLFEEPLTEEQKAGLRGQWDGGVFSDDPAWKSPTREDIGKWRPFATQTGPSVAVPSDDHGPAIPAQPETLDDGLDRRLRETFPRAEKWPPEAPRVYEFALQDFNAILTVPYSLDEMSLDIVREFGGYVNKESAAAADWVHVYDRVTRERRTLKRPEPDATLQGLRDVAAELRRGPGVAAARGHGKSEAVRDFVRGAPVEPPFGCAALPPVGPLTSTEGLRAGDVLRSLLDGGGILRVADKPFDHSFTGDVLCKDEHGEAGIWAPDQVAFVGRPDASGWMTWAGGENPVPGVEVDVDWGSGPLRGTSDAVRWVWEVDGGLGDISRFRIVETPTAV